MATGFIARNCSALAAALIALPAHALDVAYVGAFGDKAAILSINGASPKTVKVGQSFAGVTVISVDQERATIEVEGKRRTLQRGQHLRSEPKDDGRQSAVLAADPRGNFVTEGAVNGSQVRFLVDTGATTVALPAHEAQRLGLDYRRGQRSMTLTANGPAAAWRIKLDSVKIGAIELQNVDGIVLEQGLGVALLGMTFLNRVEMKRDGETMTLIRRF